VGKERGDGPKYTNEPAIPTNQGVGVDNTSNGPAYAEDAATAGQAVGVESAGGPAFAGDPQTSSHGVGTENSGGAAYTETQMPSGQGIGIA
jgi:hypothetical protein